MPRQSQNHAAIMAAPTTARLLVEYYDTLSAEDRKEMTLSVCAALGQLTEFRNIINGMVNFEDPPKEAVLPYLD